MKTFHIKEADKTESWTFLDASDQILGKLSVRIANILAGKTDPKFSYNTVIKNKVVVTNAEKIKTTGKKLTDKVYYKHTGFPGGLRSETLGELLSRDPSQVIVKAVKGMLPKNKLQDVRIKNLFVYAGNNHPHTAQQNAKTN